MSLNSLKAYWTVPDNIQSYTTDAFIAIEKRSPVGSKSYLDYTSTCFWINANNIQSYTTYAVENRSVSESILERHFHKNSIYILKRQF